MTELLGRYLDFTEKDPPKDQAKVLTPEKYCEKDRGKVFTIKIDRKKDWDKDLGTEVRFL